MHKRIRPLLEDILVGKVVIVGIGNIMRRDDGLGPALINLIKGKVEAACIDAGTTPENYTKNIVNEDPDVVLLIDALSMERRPGDYDILTEKEILNSGFTTHDISPAMFITYLEERTKAKIYMLGVQPQNIFFGDKLSPRIKRALDEIARMLEDILSSEAKCMSRT